MLSFVFPRSLRSLVTLAPLLAGALACGGPSKLPVGVSQEPWRTRPKDQLAATKAAELAGLPQKHHELMTERQGSIGPFVARRAGNAVAMALRLQGDGSHDLVMVPVLAGGVPGGPANTIGSLDRVPQLLVVRPHGHSPKRFMAAFTTSDDQGDSLQTAVIDSDGKIVRKPQGVATSANHIGWVESLATPTGSMLLWAEEVPGNDAHLFAMSLDDTGASSGSTVRIARGALGWQARAGSSGIGIAWAQATPQGAQITFQRFTQSGDPSGLAIPLHAVGPSGKIGASGTVDLAFDGSQYIAAWTDESKKLPSVALATISEDGKASDPMRVAESPYGAELLAVASSEGRAVLAWQTEDEQRASTKYVHTALVGIKGLLPTRYKFAVEGGRTPSLAAAQGGFGWLVPNDSGAPSDGTLGATDFSDTRLIRLGLDLIPTANQSLSELFKNPVHLAWNLDCAEGPCSFLYAEGDRDVLVHAAEVPRSIEAASNGKAAPTAGPLSDAPKPEVKPTVARVTARTPAALPVAPSRVTTPAAPLGQVQELSVGEPVAAIAVARQASTLYVATLSDTPDEPNALRGAKHATLSVQRTSVTGAPLAAPLVLSTRARTLSGVAIAAAPDPRNPVAVAWVAREEGDPQVHLSKLDRDGHKVLDVLLTQVAGDAHDVTITAVPGGFLVAWIDGRDGNGEVYAARVDYDLKRLTRDERITRAKGEAFDLSAKLVGEQVLLAYGDGRDNEAGDVYLARVSTKNAARIGEELRMSLTSAGARGTALQGDGPDLRLSWIEGARSLVVQGLTFRGDKRGEPTGISASTLEASLRLGNAGSQVRTGFALFDGVLYVADRNGAGRVVSKSVGDP